MRCGTSLSTFALRLAGTLQDLPVFCASRDGRAAPPKRPPGKRGPHSAPPKSAAPAKRSPEKRSPPDRTPKARPPKARPPQSAAPQNALPAKCTPQSAPPKRAPFRKARPPQNAPPAKRLPVYHAPCKRNSPRRDPAKRSPAKRALTPPPPPPPPRAPGSACKAGPGSGWVWPREPKAEGGGRRGGRGEPGARIPPGRGPTPLFPRQRKVRGCLLPDREARLGEPGSPRHPGHRSAGREPNGLRGLATWGTGRDGPAPPLPGCSGEG
eukprot:XP_013965634.1 basic proline-rich protein-like [Canis lupus familiaris]